MNVFRALARELFERPAQVPGGRDPASLPAGSLQPVRQQRRVAPVVSLSRFRDAFEPPVDRGLGPQDTRVQDTRAGRSRSRPLPELPFDRLPASVAARPGADGWAMAMRDGFTPARRAPVELLGGRPQAVAHEEAPQPSPRPNGFLASLDDLG